MKISTPNKKGHWEITFKNHAGYNDYQSETLHQVITRLIPCTWFQEDEVTEIKFVED